MVDLVQQPATPGVPTIQGYGAGGWRVSGQVWPGGVLVRPDGVTALDGLDALAADPPAGIEVLLIGTGATMARPDAALLAALRAAAVPAEYMDSKAAARTYNVLAAEGRRVAAALLPI